MSNAVGFRRQADICLHLSLLSADLEIAKRLITMADEYNAKADRVTSDLEIIQDPRRSAER
jgi:hypothetical protein